MTSGEFPNILEIQIPYQYCGYKNTLFIITFENYMFKLSDSVQVGYLLFQLET